MVLTEDPTVGAPASGNPHKYVTGISLLVHILSIALYLFPLSYPIDPPSLFPRSFHQTAILDEMHILAKSNTDVHWGLGESSLKDVFVNDYWGRSIVSYDSSHMSYRPASILTFRLFGRTPDGASSAGRSAIHRIVTVVLHASAGELVGYVAHLLFGYSAMKDLAKIIFLLHPVHVEAVANGANRPHVLAVMCALISILGWVMQARSNDPFWDRATKYTLLGFVWGFGLLCCETAVFLLPAIVITSWTILDSQGVKGPWYAGSTRLFPAVMFTVITLAYLAGRYYYNTLAIPKGLIRPAENPYYDFSGWHRVVNYIHVLIIHFYKANGFLFDWPIGMSHEYGFECIREMKYPYMNDGRMPYVILTSAGICTCVAVAGVTAWKETSQAMRRRTLLLTLTYFAWMATLFPISGILRVGTFVADRILFPYSVATSIYFAALIGWILQVSTSSRNRRVFLAFTLLLLGNMGYRTYTRIGDWTSHLKLLGSSVQSCPRCAKSLMELSKIYGGTGGEVAVDLKKTRELIDKAASIDPNFCDIHWQYAQLFLRENDYLKFEFHLSESMMCKFTAMNALSSWKNYWPVVLQDQKHGPAARTRMEKYVGKIEKERIKQEKIEQEEMGSTTVEDDGGEEELEL